MAITASVVLGPRVFAPADPAEPQEAVVVAAVDAGAVHVSELAPPRPERSPSTVVLTPSVPETTVPAPAPAPEAEEPAPTTTEAPPAPTTTEPPPTTTTTAAPPTTTTTAPPPPPEPEPPASVPAALSAEHADGTHEGMVSWYDLPGSRVGICAHRTIEKGTVVTVTNLDTGESITCTVDDRGPYSGDDKILDLHPDDFSQLAPLEQGVFPARLDW